MREGGARAWVVVVQVNPMPQFLSRTKTVHPCETEKKTEIELEDKNIERSLQFKPFPTAVQPWFIYCHHRQDIRPPVFTSRLSTITQNFLGSKCMDSKSHRKRKQSQSVHDPNSRRRIGGWGAGGGSGGRWQRTQGQPTPRKVEGCPPPNYVHLSEQGRPGPADRAKRKYKNRTKIARKRFHLK